VTGDDLQTRHPGGRRDAGLHPSTGGELGPGTRGLRWRSTPSAYPAVRYSNGMNAAADDLITEIDAAAIIPMTHAVTRGLYRHISLRDALQNEVVAAFDNGGQSLDMADFRAALWTKIDSLDAESQGGLRLLVALTHPDKDIDWHMAEFIILWARQEGVTEHQIIEAFHIQPNGS
jgi:hypothetical protein